MLTRGQLCGNSRSRRDRGYILLTLLLIIALVSIVAATAASSIAFKIRRDREEELIHRGAEYSRAIRRFTKKMGRYPLRIEDLENTDGLRFLRKRYKDPITGKDFKLLHMTDLQRVGAGGLNAAVIPPPTPQAGAAPTVSPQGDSGVNPGGNTLFGPTTPQSADSQTASAVGQDDSNAASNSAAPVNSGPNPASLSSASRTSAPQPGDSEPFGGGVIVGVASASRQETIRQFNHKNHYSDWLFFYDPGYDRGLPINGPTQLTRSTPNLAPQQPASAPPATQ